MAMISLADAVHLRARILAYRSELDAARRRGAIVLVQKGEAPDTPSTTVEQYTEQMAEASADYRMLDVAMARLNLDNRVTWDGHEIPLMEALQLAKDLRLQIAELKTLGARLKVQRLRPGPMGRDGGDFVEVAMYDPEAMRKQADQLERQVMRLSRLIDRCNEEVMFDYPPAVKYMAFD
jgi:hypothetical protein